MQRRAERYVDAGRDQQPHLTPAYFFHGGNGFDHLHAVGDARALGQAMNRVHHMLNADAFAVMPLQAKAQPARARA